MNKVFLLAVECLKICVLSAITAYATGFQDNDTIFVCVYMCGCVWGYFYVSLPFSLPPVFLSLLLSFHPYFCRLLVFILYSGLKKNHYLLFIALAIESSFSSLLYVFGILTLMYFLASLYLMVLQTS